MVCVSLAIMQLDMAIGRVCLPCTEPCGISWGREGPGISGDVGRVRVQEGADEIVVRDAAGQEVVALASAQSEKDGQ